MKTIRYYYVFLLLLLISSCTKDSSLSDVEINDPSLIQLDISLYRTRDNSGLLKSSIEVFLWDKNFNSIQLKKGKVSVNGQAMQSKILNFTGAPYYTIDTSILKVELNKLYTFTIELSDGKSYQSTITTQEVDLYSLLLPNTYSRQDDMPIGWFGYDIKNEFYIQLTCDYSFSGKSGQTINSFTPNQQERTNGSYVIPKSYFNQETGIFKATISVTSKKQGSVDNRFKVNSTIECIYTKESECNVN